MGCGSLQAMCGEKYKQFVRKQHEVLQSVAEKLERFAIISAVVTLVVFVAVGAVGIKTSLTINFDLGDVTAPVDTVYYQRYLKYKDVFAYNSTSFFQPQWAMDLRTTFLSVILYPGNDTMRPIKEGDLTGLNALNEFFYLVESFVSSDEKNYTDLCAKNSYFDKDKCVRLNLTEPFKEEYNSDSKSLLNAMITKPRRGPAYSVDYPAHKVTLESGITVLPLANAFGSSKRGKEGLYVSPCLKKVGKSRMKYNASCMSVGEDASALESIRYAWFLRHDTEEDKEQATNWMNGIHENCELFATMANNATGNAGWKFRCFSNIAPINGGIEAIQADMRFIGLAAILAMVFPVIWMVKPCCENNFAPLILIAIGVFFCTLIAAVGIGSFFGFEIVYTFVVVVVFLEWFYLRLALFITDSLKECLLIKTGEEDFPTVFAHWAPIIVSTSLILSLTCFLFNGCMYKLVWHPAAFVGIFFLLACISMLFVFFPIVSRILKSRNAGGSPCCMGKAKEGSKQIVNNPLVTRIKAGYHSGILCASTFARSLIVSLFVIFFVLCLLYSALILLADQGDETYYGYDRSSLFLPGSEIGETLEVVKKYYPDAGAGVQLIFDNRAKYWNQIGLEDFTACNKFDAACYFHCNLLIEEMFPALWASSEHMRPRFQLNFYQVFVGFAFQEGEQLIETEDQFKGFFSVPFLTGAGTIALFNDMGRYHMDALPQPPFAAEMKGDPYTRMYTGLKFMTHTAHEVEAIIKLEQAQEKLKKTASFGLANYFPPDSFEIYSPQFLLSESSRDVISRTILLPVVVIGVLILLPLCSCLAVPHPLALAAIYLNAIMLFVEFFALQMLLGTTLSNISMAFYFVMYLFSVDFSYYASHMNLKFLMMKTPDDVGPKVPLPSPIPSIASIITSLVSAFIIFLKTYTTLAVVVRNCILVFGIIGPLHEILFIPCFMSLFVGVNKEYQAVKQGKVAENGNTIELKESDKTAIDT
ncbi:uncharacterized protein LOC142339094 isoform X2 [Convolutriloba macropyga]|uniref:uncharacterized protein LOC142339094 isoform X2 n=1 Tax=Convolutriloba macropyga TaxID=536237 RepID=UPI003F523DA6